MKRPRGRPRKTTDDAEEYVVKEVATEPKKRGRPRKIKVEEEEKKKEEKAPPKKRGRPRKEVSVEIKSTKTADLSEDPTPVAPKKRGRPPKAKSVEPEIPVED